MGAVFHQGILSKEDSRLAELEAVSLLGEAGARSLPWGYALMLGIGIGFLIGAACSLRRRWTRHR